MYFTRSEDLWCTYSPLCLAGEGRRTDPITLPFPVRREQLCFSVVILSNSSALVTGLEPLLLFVILALRGLCSAGFQEHCGAAVQGWRCCASPFV